MAKSKGMDIMSPIFATLGFLALIGSGIYYIVEEKETTTGIIMIVMGVILIFIMWLIYQRSKY